MADLNDVEPERITLRQVASHLSGLTLFYSKHYMT